MLEDGGNEEEGAKAKGRHVRKAKPSDYVANRAEVSPVDFAFVEGIMGPGEDCRWPEST